MQAGLEAYRATGAELHIPYLLTLLADGHYRMNQLDAGRHMLAEALTRVRRTGECWWETEIHRLEGVYLLHQGEHHTAVVEQHLRRAVELAKQRGAKALELRASISLGRLWQSQGKLLPTRRMIGPLCQDLTEGAETPDLLEAKQLYGECAVD